MTTLDPLPTPDPASPDPATALAPAHPVGTPAAAPEPPRRGDLTQGPLVPTLLAFAVPQMVGNVLQTVNTSINAVWVGQLLGNGALAGTANANIVMFLVFSLVFGFGMAATVRIGQSYGAHDIHAVRRTLGTALTVALVISLATTIAGWLLAGRLLDLLATPGASRALALTYLRVILLSTPASMLTLTVAMALRGVGDAKTPLVVLIVTSLLDVAFNPLFIRGFGPIPAMGIAGSALATALASTIGLVAMLVLVYRRDLVLRLKGAELGYLIPARADLAYILAKGIPMGAQMLVISGAGLIFIGLVNREGIATAAAYGALLQLWNYIGMPAMAISTAVSAMVAQHIGAGQAHRVDAISLAGAATNTAITLALTGLLFAFDRPVLGLFLGLHSPAVAVAQHIQLIAIWSYIPFGITIVLFGTLRAFGAVYAQLVVMFISMYLLRLGAYYGLRPALGADALWSAMVISSVASTAMMLGVYAFGRWRRALVAADDGRPHSPA